MLFNYADHIYSHIWQRFPIWMKYMTSVIGRKKIFSDFWLLVWAFALSLAWLLPNHYAPWSSFHMDALSAAVMSTAAIAVITRSPSLAVWHGPAAMAALLVVVAWLQYGFGLIALAGTAWITSAYLLGFLLAVMTGSRWESASSGQLVDGVFAAVLIAALVSVGLQLHQWLMLDGLHIWSMGQGYGRPFANFGQPNQLATLLLWALLSVAWGLSSGRIGLAVSVPVALYLLFGLALTASRTAWLAMTLFVAVSWWWRSLWSDRRLPWLVSSLAIVFVAYVSGLSWLSKVLMIAPAEVSDIARMGTETRPMVWAMFVDAALQHPLWGYGWGPLSVAQLAVATEHPAMQTVYSQSHNLFFDFILWCGFPIGLLVSSYLVWWLCTRVKRVALEGDALLLLFVMVVANHAMLEFPLQYAYFLLPVGLMMGAIDTRFGFRSVLTTGRWVSVGLCFSAVLLLALLIRDYSKVETSYQALRFEWARIQSSAPASPPDVLLLNQWREFVWYVRLEPSADMPPADIELMRQLTKLYPSTGFIQKLAAALALNGRPDEAGKWLKKACRVASAPQCLALKDSWAQQSLADPRIAASAWPE